MKLYREDGKDIEFAKKYKHIYFSILYLVPIVMGMLCNCLFAGLMIFNANLIMIIMFYISIDNIYNRYLLSKININGMGI